MSQHQRHRTRRVILAIVSALMIIGLIIWTLTRVANNQASSLSLAEDRNRSPMALSSLPTPEDVGKDENMMQAHREMLKDLKNQLVESQQRLKSYQVATRYPFESQPISEHLDQIEPFLPIQEDNPLRTSEGDAIAGRHLLTTQERVYVSGQESVLFTVALVDDNHQRLPLQVTRAVAHLVDASNGQSLISPIVVLFDDKGINGDVNANEQILTTRFKPFTQGFSDKQGTIRLELSLQSDTGAAKTFFDIIYMPVVPATWTNTVDEKIENGSLSFYLKANVLEAGRYLISARAYDAKGKAFALLTFNDEVAVGSQAFKLTLFGKLIHDLKPTFPITLRDVEGYLLYEDHFPDRALMPRQLGVVHTSAQYAISAFATNEWNSEERDRHLTEYSKDVTQTEASIKELEDSNN